MKILCGYTNEDKYALWGECPFRVITLFISQKITHYPAVDMQFTSSSAVFDISENNLMHNSEHFLFTTSMAFLSSTLQYTGTQFANVTFPKYTLQYSCHYLQQSLMKWIFKKKTFISSYKLGLEKKKGEAKVFLVLLHCILGNLRNKYS